MIIKRKIKKFCVSLECSDCGSECGDSDCACEMIKSSKKKSGKAV